MNTPWGKSDSVIRIARGLSWVSTPSHGGFAVAEATARKLLSISAQQRGEFRNHYFFFEEDCDYAIVALEVFLVTPTFARKEAEIEGLGKFTYAHLLRVLSSYHADYLQERGIEPDPEGLAVYNAYKLHDRLLAERSPSLITSAVGDWHHDCPKGFVLVTTANNSRWLVPAAEYSEQTGIVKMLESFSSKQAVVA